MPPRCAPIVFACALIAAVAGCKKSDGVVCDPPLDPTCPNAGAPSFADDVYPNVFVPYCVSCHSSTGVESSTLLTSYAQIYGQNGAEASEIFTQVFENCLMPPSNADAQLADGFPDGGDGGGPDPRQTLLDWLACGAPNN